MINYYQLAFLAMLVLMVLASAGCVMPGAALRRYIPEEYPLDRAAGEIRLLVWNLAKGDYGQVEPLVEALDPNLLCLQEVPDPDGKLSDYYAAFASNLELNGRAYGLAQISAEHPQMVRRLLSRGREPVAGTRKQVLACRYGTGADSVLVLNVHALNFTRIGSYERQLASLDGLLEEHRGPVVLCGDFNTWSRRRAHALERWTSLHDLRPVDFGRETGAIRRFMNSGPFDRIYIRELGVRLGSADVLEGVGGSDHRPLFVVLERPTIAQTTPASSPAAGLGVAPVWVATQAP